MLFDQKYQTLADADKADAIAETMRQAGWQPPAIELQHYQQWIQTYTQWHAEHTGIQARITPQCGKAIKSIGKYLTSQSHDQTEQGGLDAFKYILAHWTNLSDFIARQITLPQINKNLSEILQTLRTHGKRADHNKAKSFANEFKRKRD